ncbi:MAG TPA: type I restriction endonuclease subunit R [Bacteroidetes bacterium]|nr:type I restriction endonuclease subunit R [Bacteroidota bacterium]HIL56322.1 type I restriction endonuclease subunit R [Rhodothermales bacterium]
MSTQRYTEESFEDHVVAGLEAAGYRALPHAAYDRELCLLPEELLAFLRATQPEEVERLEAQYGAEADRAIARRVSREVGRRGLLSVLREGVKDRGVALRLAYFRPSSGLNPEHERRYRLNRFAAVRQLRYSRRSGHSLDLGLFLNGLPVLTAELKNSLTGQTVAEAVKQYRQDRDPREPLFAFGRCVAHFAVGNEEAYYTTRLAKGETFFLPFNRGAEGGGAGNPVNPDGHATAYLWEDTWRPDTLLALLSGYLHVQTTASREYDPKRGAVVEKTSEALIFPRYHQLDVVRRLLAAAAREGPGHRYLVQHSAGSGKSNSIAWLAHGLRQLHDADGERLFDTVVVVTDRRVLDQQLQRTIKQFERTAGTVVPIDGTSAQLRKALEQGKDIVVTTLQKFPVISAAVSELAGRRFAVVVDEAHSSQSGEGAKHLKATLSAGLEDAEAEDAAPFDLEDAVAAEVRTRGRQPHLSYFAFTATPKDKTLELFGRRGPDGEFRPFHTYTMRQAIEERFILDVLRNYTTYARYFKLAAAADEDEEVEKGKAVRALTSYVDLTDHAVDEKARVCLDHFERVTLHAVQGRGRAMFVTRSRLHAVRFFLAFRRLMAERGLAYGPLVAFSGTVRDPETGAEHTEASLNRLPKRTGVPDAFKLPEYRLLVVANKYQTGFDEPLLHTMYVDKRLGGVQAVQTLSRLNRTTRGKEDTVVLDFVNEAEAIQAAFQPYYQNTALEEETDPNALYDLTARLAAFDLYTPADVDAFAAVFFDPRVDGKEMQPILDRVVGRWRQRDEEEREAFRSALQSFARLYGYVSQLVTFVDTDLEKEYAFARALNRKLDKRTGGGLPQGLTDAVDLDSFRLQMTHEGAVELEAEDARLPGIRAEGAATVADPEFEYLSVIVDALNDTFGLDLDEKDRVRVEEIVREVREDEAVRAVMSGNNSVSNKRHKVHAVVEDRVRAQVDHSIGLYRRLSEKRVKDRLKSQLFDLLLREFADSA